MYAIVISILAIVGSSAAAVGGLLLMRRISDVSTLKAHHEVAGYLMGVIGTLYAVLLGLVIVDVQSKYQQARMMEESEASAIVDLFFLAGSFSQKVKIEIRKDLNDYVNQIVNSEWDSADRDGTFSRDTIKSIQGVTMALQDYEPKSNREVSCYQMALTVLGQLADSRRFRIVTAMTGVSPFLWCVLVAGAVLTVMFTFFFACDSLKNQIIMTIFLSVALTLNMLLVVLYGNPYKGDFKVQPIGFKYNQKVFKEVAEGTIPGLSR